MRSLNFRRHEEIGLRKKTEDKKFTEYITWKTGKMLLEVHALTILIGSELNFVLNF